MLPSSIYAIALIGGLLQLSTCSPTSTGSPTKLPNQYPNCLDVVIPITVKAEGISLDPGSTFEEALQQATQINSNAVNNILGSVLDLVFDLAIQGKFDIAGTYCEPAVSVPSRANTLQFLLHGATYDRKYWYGDGLPGQGYDNNAYSWVEYASNQGYPTFAIDRLGSGNSSHPDPILVVQTPTEVETVHQIITMARAGSSPFPRKFKKVVVVGHSLGSIVTQSLSVVHPTDADSYILTGYSKYIVNFLPGIFVTGVLLPAALVQPSKFASLPVGYLEADSFDGIVYLFWYDPYRNGTYYDPAFPAFDFAQRQTITVGEGATGAFTADTSSFSGPVLAISGQQDVLFCGTNALEIDGPGECVSADFNYLLNTGSLYPKAQYSWYSVPNANHCWQFHYSAQHGFAVTHEWLADHGF